MSIEEKYNQWLSFVDKDTKEELLSIKNNEKEIEDRFYKDLSFGTGGLRGIMGAGSNRMNKYTVGKATIGLANYLQDKYSGEISVAVAYDSRNNSSYFAQIVADLLATQGINVFLYEMLEPVAVLSFTTSYLSCKAGIMITASHNPKEYNGYKVYDSKGCQICPDDANELIGYINKIEDYSSIPFNSVAAGKITMIGNDIFSKYLENVRAQSLYNNSSDLKVVYTPLHGAGDIPVRTVLNNYDVTIVSEQEKPDGNFPTVKSPNPEEKGALALAIETAKKTGADLVLGTDPDCDRVGIAVRNNTGEFVLFTGNQTGALLVNFVLEQKKQKHLLNDKSVVIKTIVTSELGAQIGRKYGVGIEETLTGFKYIGNKINEYEVTGEHEFVIGYEESYGYLVGTYARDKDAVVSSMLICEMAAWYRSKGMSLIDALNNIYKEYGYYLDALDPFVLNGKSGKTRIDELMEYFRQNWGGIFTGVKTVLDYSNGICGLPKENVLKFIFKDSSWLAVRPSGTEPKIKVYYSIRDDNKESASHRLSVLRKKMSDIILG